MNKTNLNYSYAKFLRDKNQKILLLNTPNYGNVGDSAITLGLLALLQDNFPHHSIYEFSGIDDSLHLKNIEKHLSKNDVVVINGGGSIGSLWKIEHARIMRIVRTFKRHKIVIGPQTIFFKKEDEKLLKDFISAVTDCQDLTILVREHNSLKFLQQIKAPCKFELVPDAAIYLNPNSPPHKNADKVLLCFRNDHEKVLQNKDVVDFLKKRGIKFDTTNTNLPRAVSKKGRRKFVENKIAQFSHYQLVMTDRLHGMVLAALANTPCLAFDNVSKKVSGVYQWMQNLEYVKCIDKQQFNAELFDRLYNTKECKFDNSRLAVYFQKMVDAIKI